MKHGGPEPVILRKHSVRVPPILLIVRVRLMADEKVRKLQY